ncbi:MAG: hypothetical protein HS103_06310 [Anaerolineales bacterium]|nr:hypothetical protein [Anaerolineales bacterium]
MPLRDDALGALKALRDDNISVRDMNLQHFSKALTDELGIDHSPSDFITEVEDITFGLVVEDDDQLTRVTENTPLLSPDKQDLFIAIWAWPDAETRRRNNQPRWLIVNSKVALGELIEHQCIAEYISRYHNKDLVERYKQQTPRLRRSQ